MQQSFTTKNSRRNQAWEAEHDLAKEERKPRWTKPKQGLLEKPVPRAKMPDDESSESDKPDNNNNNMINGN